MIPIDCSPPPTCCNTFFDVAALLAEGAAEAVNDCLAGDECDLVTARVTQGAPVGPKDYVAAWVRSADPPARPTPFPRWTVSFGLRLLESGFPTAVQDSGGLSIPSSSEWSAASEHSYAHGMALFNFLHGAVNGALGDSPATRHIDCGVARVGRMEIVAPLGGVGGWDYTAFFGVTA